MGLGLKLLIAQSMSPNCDTAHDIISLNHCPTDILQVIQKVEAEHGIDVKRGGISTFLGRSGTKYGYTTTTPYGERMKSVLAGELQKAFKNYKDGSNWDEKAVIAYVKKLPKGLPIYLYWN